MNIYFRYCIGLLHNRQLPYSGIAALCMVILLLPYLGCHSTSQEPDATVPEAPEQPRGIGIDVIIPRQVAQAELDRIDHFEVTVSGPNIKLFDTEPRLPVGQRPQAVAFGDLDADGFPDLIVANSNSDNVAVLFGPIKQEDVSFGEPALISVGTGPEALALGDMDGDGRLDVVTANSGSNDISVFDASALTRDDQVGARPLRHSIGGDFPIDVALGDVDGDGDLDVVTANGASDNLSLLLSLASDTGARDFQAPQIMPIEGVPSAVKLGDMDGDGHLDLVLAIRQRNFAMDDSLRLIRGDGAGGFEAMPVDISLGKGRPVALAIGDVDSDHVIDLVVTANQTANTVSVLFFDHANLQVQEEISVGAGPTAVALANPADGDNLDGDPDGYPDIVVANAADGDVTLIFGTGDMSFAPQERRIVVGASPSSVIWGNINDDENGNLDMITTNASSNDVSVLFGTGQGTFLVQPGFGAGEGTPVALASAEIDGNAGLDLLIANHDPHNVSILLNNGIGGFDDNLGDDIALNESPTAMISEHVDQDPYIDVVVTTRGDLGLGNVVIKFGDGEGGFTRETVLPVSDAPTALALGDVDGNGHMDIVAVKQSVDNASVWLQNAQGVFEEQPPINVGSVPVAVALGHVNSEADLDLDLVVINQAGVLIRLGRTGGIFDGSSQNINVGSPPAALALADVNNDGYTDVITASGQQTVLSNMSVLLGEGNGTFSEQFFLNAGSGASALAVRDINAQSVLDVAERRLDMMVANQFSNDVTVLLGQGDKIYSRQSIPVAGGPIAVLAGQFNDDNQDGQIDRSDFFDLVTANRRTNNISILLSTTALKNIPVDVNQDVITFDGETYLAFVLTIPEDQPIPQGPDMVFSVRAFARDSRRPILGGDRAIDFFNPDDNQRIVISNFAPIVPEQ